MDFPAHVRTGDWTGLGPSSGLQIFGHARVSVDDGLTRAGDGIMKKM